MFGVVLGCAEKVAEAPAAQTPAQVASTGPAPAQSVQPAVRDDPASCIDSGAAQEVQEPEPDVQKVVMAGVRELGVCARGLAKPIPVAVRVRFNSDGSVGAVSIPRAATDNCAALDCVRQRLATLRGPRTEWGKSGGADFLLRSQPSPDGIERISWSPETESSKCTDRTLGEQQTRSGESIQAKVLSNQARFRACYNEGLKVDPQLRGRVRLRFLISPSGLVAKVRVLENELTNCEVSACLRREVSQLSFDRSEDAATVYLPFVFQPED